MPACHAVVRGPARLTQKKITSNRQTTWNIRYGYGLLRFFQLPFARKEKPYRVIGHSPHPPTQAQGLHLAELAAQPPPYLDLPCIGLQTGTELQSPVFLIRWAQRTFSFTLAAFKRG